MKIKRLEIRNLYGQDIKWDLFPDVNILVGINGSGKTTILNLLEEALKHENDIDFNARKFDIIDEMIVELEDDVIIKADAILGREIINSTIQQKRSISKVDTFDSPFQSKQPDLTLLDHEINLLKEGFITYQRDLAKNVERIFRRPDDRSQKEKLEDITNLYKNKNYFLEALKELFSETGKSFNEDKFNFTKAEKKIPLESHQLSSGEKQVFIILLSVLLQKQEPYILLLDEPELSLHVSWQRKLIPFLQHLNPYCQLIIVTHSPTIFYAAYEKKLTYVEDISEPSDLGKSSPILSSFRDKSLNIIKRNLIRFSELESKSPIESARNHRTLTYIFEKLPCVSMEGVNEIVVREMQAHVLYRDLIYRALSWEVASRLFELSQKQGKQTIPHQPLSYILMGKIPSVEKGLDLVEKLPNYDFSIDINHFKILLGKSINSEDAQKVEEARKHYNISPDKEYRNRLKIKL